MGGRMIAQTVAQRKAAERQRHKDEGRSEVRGIYAPPEQHAEVKEAAAKVARRRARAAKAEHMRTTSAKE